MAKLVRWSAGLCAVVAILIGAIYGERVMSARRWERWHQKGRDAEATWALQKRAAESARDTWQAASAKSRGENFLKAFDRDAWHLITSLAAYANTALLAGDCELAEKKYVETTGLLAQLVKASADCKLTIRPAKSYDIFRVAFSPDGRTLVSIDGYSGSAFNGRRVMLWNVDTGEEIRSIRYSGASRVVFSPDGKMIAMGSAGSNGTVSMWNAQTGHLIRSIRGYVGDGSYDRSSPLFAFNPDGKTLVTAGRKGSMKLWSTATGDCIRTFKGHDAWHVSALIISTDDGTLITTAVRGNVRFWDPETGDLLRKVKSGLAGSAFTALSPNGKMFVTGGRRESTMLWNATTGEHLRTIESEKAILAAAFSPDGSILVTGGEDTTVKLWHPATGDCIRTIEGHAHPVTTVAFSSDGKTIASGSVDRTIKLWNVEIDPSDPIAHPSADRLLRAMAQTACDLWAAALKRALGKRSLSDCVGEDWDAVRAGETAAETAMQSGDYVRAERAYREAMRLLAATRE